MNLVNPLNKRIFILSHRHLTEDFPYDKNFHVRVQCGANGNHMDGFDFFDDSMENAIRDLNWCFSEATAINAIANNISILDGCEYAGFCHYRRYLEFDDLNLSEKSIICHSYELRIPIISQYKHCHPLEPMVKFVELMSDIDKTTSDEILYFLNNSDTLYMANCFVSGIGLMKEYLDFVRLIVPVMEKIVRSGCIACDEKDNYQKRYMSFVFERMTCFWIWKAGKNGISIIDVPMVKLDIENKFNSIG